MRSNSRVATCLLMLVTFLLLPACTENRGEAKQTSARDSLIVWGKAEVSPTEVLGEKDFSWSPSCVNDCSVGNSGNVASILFTRLAIDLQKDSDPRSMGKVTTFRIPFSLSRKVDSLYLIHGLRMTVTKSRNSRLAVMVYSEGKADIVEFPRGVAFDVGKDTLVGIRRAVAIPAADHVVTISLLGEREPGDLAFLSLDSDDIRATDQAVSVR